MSTMLWLILIVAFVIAFSAIANANGFNVLTTPDGKSRFAFLEGLFKSSKPDDKRTLTEKWLDNLDSESSPGLQFVVFVIALLLAYTEFHITGTVWAALIFLLVAAVIKPPKSKITKGFMYFDLGVIILAAFFTGFAGMRHQSFEIVNAWASNGNEAMAQYAKSLKDKTPSVSQTTQNQPSVATAMYHPPQPRTFHQELHAEPHGPFQTVETPAEQTGRISWSCPRGCIVEIQHEGDLLCSSSNAEVGGVYQNVPCKVDIIGQTSTGAKMYREQFLQKLGSQPLNTPRNLMHVIYSFGTTEEIGPIDVKVDVEVTETVRS